MTLTPPIRLRPADAVPRVALAVVSAAALALLAGVSAAAIRQFLLGAEVGGPDRDIAAWLHAFAGATTMTFLIGVTYLHGTVGILVLTAVAAAVVRHLDPPYPWPWPFLAVPAVLLLNTAIKQAVERPRPQWGYALQTLQTSSFPSGHTACATVFYGVLLGWAWSHWRGAAARAAWLFGAVGAVLLVATSRIALGEHYFSDCVAALLEGLLWLAICWPRSAARTLP
ncbi:MAG: phosphatase PAP2 family protein [Pseudomonadota bacterium]|nr:phosphatase PAP2 family protein [Pseudomonadota bacterium]